MRTPLDKVLRKKLEDTVVNARDIVEIAVSEALTRLGIAEGNAPSYLCEKERKLRNRLRGHGRQLGDVLQKDSGKQETDLLINEMAYEHWHRMLFARFLEQSDLLMYEPGTPVTLTECFELAEEEPDCKDGWELAGRLAQKMLPQIFRVDSPVFEVKLSINHVNSLEELIAALHLDTFQASDSLGWCYQFWQNKKKKQVNESGVKIGANELSAVTQLFTEPYMVSFLLDNALGAWWAKRRLTQDDLQTATSEKELRDIAAIPGVPLEYLRFVKDEDTSFWKSAAGDFDKWPDQLGELKTLDPCCGSGHFLVAAFLMLVPMRMQLEVLTANQAIDKVLSENIHGLELDQRCVELAVFALALEAWRFPGAAGYRALPELQLACSGVSIVEAQKEWKYLAKDDKELQGAIQWMQQTFKDAPTLGSLIDPKKSKKADWETIENRLNQLLVLNINDESKESNIVAQGLIKASALLSNKYNYLMTNVPYLALTKQDNMLKSFCENNYPAGKNDLATVFLNRCLELCVEGGSSSIVLPQNWLFLNSYKEFRKKLLENDSWNIIARLGPKGFQTPMWDFNVQLITISKGLAKPEHLLNGVDVSALKTADDKNELLKSSFVIGVKQYAQLDNPSCLIKLNGKSKNELLISYADCYLGICTGDMPRFSNLFWELNKVECYWRYFLSTPKETSHYAGMEKVLLWENGHGKLEEFVKERLNTSNTGAWIRGKKCWGRKGVAVKQMGTLPVSLYNGELFDDNVAVIIPNSEEELRPIFSYCASDSFNMEVRKVNQKLAVKAKYFLQAEIEFQSSQEAALKAYPNGLPRPYTDNSTQWIFHGHPCASVIWDEETKTTVIGDLRQDDTVLQVAVARLLGYRWPAELDTEMELASEMRQVLTKCKDFEGLVDDDGIVCIPSIRGEKSAIDRLEDILHAAYGDEWSATVLNKLLTSVKSRDLTFWLRDKFFEQHSKLFQHRPFIWQIWDGLPDGFSALVNYHMLDYKGLERLMYTYLDDWISTQIQLEKDGDEGAEIRLSAARNLKTSLEAILVGESNGKEGLDIFVRWKPLAEQPIGWNPDLNDGVRLNIRPFMQAKDVGKKEAGVLRIKPNIHWKKDRGTDVPSAPWFDLGLEYGGNQGDRINDHHLTLAEKKAARDTK